MNNITLAAILILIVWPAFMLLLMYLFGGAVKARMERRSRTLNNRPEISTTTLSALFQRMETRQQKEARWIILNIQSCRTPMQLECCKKMMGLFVAAYPDDTYSVDQMLDALYKVESQIQLFT
ncbi:MAG: hypothetical protein M9898_02065 [Chitinophagaceae bacterium]|nr:hypothetical protein [Chitinophagaceae bacterium]